MKRDQASEIAARFLELEGNTGTPQSRETDLQAITRCLESSLPDLDGPWGFVELSERQESDDAAPPTLLATDAEGTVLVARIERAKDEHSEWPTVVASRFGQLRWSLAKVATTLHQEDGAERVRRVFYLRLSEVDYSFTTNQLVVNRPEPSEAEQIGQHLASLSYMPIGSVSADRDMPAP